MAQPIQGYGTYAREALGLASAARGNEGMLRNSAPAGMYNREDSGPESMPEINPQPYNNNNMTLQNQQQNVMSMIPQAEAAAIQDVRNNVRRGSQAEFDAITLREDYKGAVASKMQNTALNAMADPQTSVAVNKAVLDTQRQEPFANASMSPQHIRQYGSTSLPMV